MAEAVEAAVLLRRRMLHQRCRTPHRPCLTPRHRQCRIWQLSREWPHRTWRDPHRTWPRRISPHRRIWLRTMMSLHLRTWRMAAGSALPPRVRHLTQSPAAHLIMKLPTSQRSEVSRTAEERQLHIRNNASAPSMPHANSSTAQRARRRPRRTRSSVEKPMCRARPWRGNGPARMVMRPLARARPVPGKARLASREIRETCHALRNVSPSSAEPRSFEIRCLQASKLHAREREEERSRNRHSEAASPSRPCMIIAIATIAT